MEVKDLRFSTCAYFYKKTDEIKARDITAMLNKIKESKDKIFFKKQGTYDSGIKYSILVSKEIPQTPKFIIEQNEKYQEHKIGYFLFIEYNDYVAILKKHCTIPKEISSKLENIDYNKLIYLFSNKDTEFTKLSMQSLDSSEHAMQHKSYESINLKNHLSPIGTSRYFIKTMKGNNGKETFALTLSTSRISNAQNSYTFDQICAWIKKTIDRLSQNSERDSDFLEIFAKPIKFAEIRNQLKPSSLLLHYGLIEKLHDEEDAKFYHKKNGGETLINDEIFRRWLRIRRYSYPSTKSKNGKHYTGRNDKIEIQIQKNAIKLINHEWDNIVIKDTYNQEYDGTLSDLINKNSLFNVYFSNNELIYSNNTLFKDTKLLSSRSIFIDLLEGYITEDLKCEKFYDESIDSSKISTEGLNDWHQESTFKYIENKYISKYDYFICDDCGTEWADHIGLNDGTVTFFVEKHNKSLDSASDFQDVVGQALKNMSNLMPSKGQLEKKRAFWSNMYEKSNIKRFRSQSGNVDDAINLWLKNNLNPSCKRELCLVVDFLDKERFKEQLNTLFNNDNIPEQKSESINHEEELKMRLWLLSSFINTCLEYGVIPRIICKGKDKSK